MKKRFVLILVILFIISSVGVQAINYYCEWSWPQKIINQDTKEALYTCPHSAPYCNKDAALEGETECCQRDTVNKIYYDCIDAEIEPVDLCAEACPDITEECSDGYEASCTQDCDSTIGICESCEPDCSGHDDLCAEACPDITEECSDGYEASCTQDCDSTIGICESCEPDCSGHETTTIAKPSTTTVIQNDIQTVQEVVQTQEEENVSVESIIIEEYEEEILINTLPEEMPIPGSEEIELEEDIPKIETIISEHSIKQEDIIEVEEVEDAYTIKTSEKVKLFGFISLNKIVVTTVDSETLDIISKKQPWWNWFVQEEEPVDNILCESDSDCPNGLLCIGVLCLEKGCGDEICDEDENPMICPEDCIIKEWIDVRWFDVPFNVNCDNWCLDQGYKIDCGSCPNAPNLTANVFCKQEHGSACFHTSGSDCDVGENNACGTWYTEQQCACEVSKIDCIDTDNTNEWWKAGIFDPNQVYTKGRVWLGDGGEESVDHCNDNYSVVEYYCDEDGKSVKETLSHEFNHVCRDGALIWWEEEEALVCTDTDNNGRRGRDNAENQIYTKGASWVKGVNSWITGVEVSVDICRNDGLIIEYYCNTNGYSMEMRTMPCPGGYSCRDGMCITNVEPVCTDTDSGGQWGGEITGSQIYTKGTTWVRGGEELVDSCRNNYALTEHYCNPNGRSTGSTTWDCPIRHFCQDGACVVGSLCTDTDNNGRLGGEITGSQIYTKGTTRMQGGEERIDSCITDSSLTEHYCNPNGRSIGSTSWDCPYRYVCQDGACILE